eukprot:scaffold8266_cov51-Attheya_sp.AAC.2
MDDYFGMLESNPIRTYHPYHMQCFLYTTLPEDIPYEVTPQPGGESKDYALILFLVTLCRAIHHWYQLDVDVLYSSNVLPFFFAGRIDWSFNSLSGTMPEKLNEMSTLETLVLSRNKLTGTLAKFPSSIRESQTGHQSICNVNVTPWFPLFTLIFVLLRDDQTEHIELNDNNLVGGIDGDFFNLRNLRKFLQALGQHLECALDFFLCRSI